MGSDLRELRDAFAGDVLAPGEDGYDAARGCFNALIDRRPAAIARCTGAGDVAAALGFARANGLEVAVRGGGHNPAGHCVVDDGLVIDLSRMRAVEVDGEARIARAEGGSTWLDFDTATQAHGLVGPGGIVGSTGVCGLALGGGIGYLTAQHGLTCDNLVGAEIVTPSGELVRADAQQNPDLLWALRGGGGNFGVALRLEFQLQPLERVVGGVVTYAGKGVPEAFRRFRDLVSRAPHELSLQAELSVDESVTPTFAVIPCYTGAATDPEELAALRSAPGLVDYGVREHGFLDQQLISNPAYGEVRHYWKGHFVRELPDELIDELLVRIVALGRVPGLVLFESLHGAPKDADPDAAAVGFRDAAFNVSVMSAWRDPALDEEQIAWARETAAVLEPWSMSGGYVNYMQADEPVERVKGAFGDEAFERLQALKARYDPDNILRRNQNIPPA
jgi:FAD/FMN-containing dehydrogenase